MNPSAQQEVLTNLLKCTNDIGTLLQTVDITTKRLMKVIGDLDVQISQLRRKRDAAYTALELAGVRPKKDTMASLPSQMEIGYKANKPFADMMLSKACLKVLRDNKGEWLTKANVEYLVALGGYVFDTDDPKNSVNVTLRRLTSDGKIEAERIRGSRGNKYRWVDSPDEESRPKRLS